MTYVALVRDYNTIANNYVVSHYVTPTPTVMFDGGVESFMGGGTGMETYYAPRIQTAGARTVPDLHIITSMDWLGDGAGYYAVRVHVAISNGVDPNTAPSTPAVPTGPARAGKDVEVEFETTATDAESNLLYCQWDFGDGTVTDWLGPFDSGTPMTATHAWSEETTFAVRVKVKDPFGEETAWVDAAPITVSCCSDRVGDANMSGDDEPTIGDISAMIDARFISGDETILDCLTEADINQSGGENPTIEDITIGDISYLIDYLYITGNTLGLNNCF